MKPKLTQMKPVFEPKTNPNKNALSEY